MFAWMASHLLQGATTVHDDVTHLQQDVRIIDGVISDVGQLSPRTDEDVTDLVGMLLLPAAVEPHAHLDKAFLAERIENPSGDLMGAIEAMAAHRHLLDVGETIERAERAARLMASNGFGAVRSHADTTLHHGLRSIEALAEVKRRVADVIDVEIVALSGWPVTGPGGADQRALLHDAMQAGADLVGGCPHLEGGDTLGPTEFFLQAAVDHGVGVDLHTDETLDPSAAGLADLARLVAGGFPHGVTASHCVSLGMQAEAERRATSEAVAAAGIGVVALPHTNLFLQGRGHSPMPRGLTAVPDLRDAGARVAAGADNLQDPFNPVGRACPFETAALMMMAAHLLPHEAYASVSTVAGSVTGLMSGRDSLQLATGQRADLVAVQAATVREAIAFGPPERIVWRAGERLVS